MQTHVPFIFVVDEANYLPFALTLNRFVVSNEYIKGAYYDDDWFDENQFIAFYFIINETMFEEFCETLDIFVESNIYIKGARWPEEL